MISGNCSKCFNMFNEGEQTENLICSKCSPYYYRGTLNILNTERESWMLANDDTDRYVYILIQECKESL